MIPLIVDGGLSYMSMYPPSDHELDTLPYEFMTYDSQWDPSCLDSDDPLEFTDHDYMPDMVDRSDWNDSDYEDSSKCGNNDEDTVLTSNLSEDFDVEMIVAR